MDRINVYAVKLGNKIAEPVFCRLLGFVAKAKKERILKFVRREDAERVLLSELLIRHLIITKLGIRNHEISFGFNEYGKPFLNNERRFHFNISHAGEWVVCAIDREPLGIDIEPIESVDFSIAEHFFSKTEYRWLMAKEEPERLFSFFDLWTLKESYLKATGKGLSSGLGFFSIIIKAERISVSSPDDPNSYYFKRYSIDPRYKLAVCARNPDFADEVTLIQLDAIIEWFLNP